MKKFVFLALLFFFYYTAAMYEMPALMTAFLAQLFLVPVMLGLALYLREHLSVSFSNQIIFVQKGKQFPWEMDTENTSRLSVSRFKVRLYIRYGDTKKTVRKTVKGNCVCGKDTLVYNDMAKHCGICFMQMHWLKVYDYLSLFSTKKAVESRMEAAVLPPKYDIKIRYGADAAEGRTAYQKESVFQGSHGEEIRQLREFRDGDLLRDIHWKQTAHMGQLWVKEYEEETKGQARLYLDMSGLDKKSSVEKDWFYTLLYAILRGLINEGWTVLAEWSEKNRVQRCQKGIRDERNCIELLVLIFRGLDKVTGCKPERQMDIGNKAMRLTEDLSWYAGERLIRKFSGEGLEKELTELTFWI